MAEAHKIDSVSVNNDPLTSEVACSNPTFALLYFRGWEVIHKSHPMSEEKFSLYHQQ